MQDVSLAAESEGMCDDDEAHEQPTANHGHGVQVEHPGQIAQRARHRMDERAAELLFAVKHAGFVWGERSQRGGLNAVAPRASNSGARSAASDQLPVARCELVPPVAPSEPMAAAAEAPVGARHPTALHVTATDDVLSNEVVGALKRKLIELEGERQTAVRRAGLLEQELVIEKRGHQASAAPPLPVLLQSGTGNLYPTQDRIVLPLTCSCPSCTFPV